MTTLTPLARVAAIASLLAGVALAQAAQLPGGTIGNVISSSGNGAGELRTAASAPQAGNASRKTAAAQGALPAASAGKQR